MPDIEQMIVRQQVLADFGDLALRSNSLDELLTDACGLIGRALGTARAKVMEIEHGGRTLLMRAGVGWEPGIVGRLRVKLSESSLETFSIYPDSGGTRNSPLRISSAAILVVA